MHFELIKDEFYKNIIKSLLDFVPEFKTSFDTDESPYVIIGEFGRFLIESINRDDILKKSIDFINKAIELGGHETLEVIDIEIFETIFDNDINIEKIRKLLSNKALKIFDESKKKYDKFSL